MGELVIPPTEITIESLPAHDELRQFEPPVITADSIKQCVNDQLGQVIGRIYSE